MWTVLGTARGVVVCATLCVSTQGFADSNYYQNNQNFGMNLPQAALPTGTDEIRTTDGATCRSAVGGDGAYMDVGFLGSPENADTNGSAAAYGRLVIPLGAKPKRLDCSKLYNLEIQRLKMELELARMGAGGTANTAAAATTAGWAEEGWGNQPAGIPASRQPEPAAVVYAQAPKVRPTPAKPRKKPGKAQASEPITGIY